MRTHLSVMLALTAIAGAGCSRFRTTPDAGPQSARAELRDTSGRRVGDATLQQMPRGVLIVADLSSIPSGTHAMHVHAVGQCVPPFESAGGHFNPAGVQHGYRNPSGHHAGDLPNINVGSGGTLRIEHFVAGMTLGGDDGVLDGDGAAVVIHAFPDDYTTDPAGGAGARIACGAITR